MADMNIAERFMPQDGHIQIHHRGARVDIRVGTMPTIYGESMVMRLLEKNTKPLSTPGTGPGRRTRRACSTGWWRSRTAFFWPPARPAAAKRRRFIPSCKASTRRRRKSSPSKTRSNTNWPGVAQIPVRPSRNFTFASGLRSILRQDPDVVMVGEIRDSETAEIAIRAALTGHQVFSTLHTNDSTGAVTRLLDMGDRGLSDFLVARRRSGAAAGAEDLPALPR